MGGSVLTVPNALSGFRVGSVPVLLLLAWTGHPRAFLVLLSVSFLTDSVDGWLARHWHENSAAGARLDTWGDLSIYTSLPLCAWWLWPDIVRREAAFIVPVLASFFVPITCAFLKYGRLTSYHTWLAKLSTILMSVCAVLLFARLTPWPFRICAVVPVLEAIEELLMILVLREWRSDVPTLWHALAIRRQERRRAQEARP